ncbi:MAG: hypothetical protein E6R04_08960 [Spirochaetes bacterium]|nr:MAG: hypothetical protein E6R04_08960 [Spirochaetota bacterium]
MVAMVAGVLFGAGIAHADDQPLPDDPHMPDISIGKCVKGVSDMGLVKHCLGEPYPDGTYWMENLWTTILPVIGAQPYQTNGVHCVIGEYPGFVNPAPVGGCNGAVPPM